MQHGKAMNPADFISARTAAGESTTEAVRALAAVLCIKERRAWLLYTGAATATPAQQLLLSIWHSETALRHYWERSLSASSQ